MSFLPESTLPAIESDSLRVEAGIVYDTNGAKIETQVAKDLLELWAEEFDTCIRGGDLVTATQVAMKADQMVRAVELAAFQVLILRSMGLEPGATREEVQAYLKRKAN